MAQPEPSGRLEETGVVRRLPVLDEVTGALESLAGVLDVEDDFQVLLYQVCHQVTQAVPRVAEATVTLLHDSDVRTAATTSEQVAALDQDQYRNDDGPCLQAARTGQVVAVTVAEARQRWPVFARDAREAGFGGFLSAPLSVDDRFAGAINCYSRADHRFADIDIQIIELYTTAVEAALRTHRRYATALQTAENLRIALTTRAVIDQAKGILMAIHQINADDAFTRLTEQSQRQNTKVHTIAQRLITRATNHE